MAYALVQHTNQDAGSPAGGSTTLAFGSNNAAGSLLIALLRVGQSGRTITVADNNGNTWQAAESLSDTGGNNSYAIWYAMNCNAGANTLTFSYVVNTAVSMRWIIAEYSGGALTAALDQHTSTFNSGTSAASGSVTPVQDNELAVGLIGTAAGKTITATGGMTQEDVIPAGATARVSLQDVIQSTAAAVNATATLSATDNWAAAIATFKAAANVVAPPAVNVVDTAVGRAASW